MTGQRLHVAMLSNLETLGGAAVATSRLADRLVRGGYRSTRIVHFESNRPQRRETVPLDQGRTVNNADVSFSLHPVNGQTLMVLSSSDTGKRYTVADEHGAFRSRIARLPLTAGGNGVGGRILIGGEGSEWPRGGVGLLKVAGGDFFGIGHPGFGATAPVYVDGIWF